MCTLASHIYQGFDLEGSSPTFIAISLGQDGTLFGLTSNYSLVIDLPPEVRRIQAKEKYKLLMEMDKEKPKHNELNNNNMMITDESRGKSHTLSTSRLTYSDGKLKEMKRISEKSDPNALIEEARALLHKAKESGANLKGRKRKTKDDEYDNGYYSDASYDSLDSRDFNDGEGPCFTCGHDPSNDTFRWDTIPEEFRQRKTSTRTFMHQEEIKDTPTLLPLPIFELDQTLQLEEEGLNRLIAYIDKDSLFRRYLWPLLLACTYVIVVLSAIISTINWSTCSLLSEPMAVLSGSLFLSALFISALHDQSEGKHGRGGITWFWIVQGVCLLLVNLIIYAYDVVLTINLFSRNSQNCDTRNTSYHWLMSMAMITLICSFLLALFFTLLAILVLFHRSHMQIPDPSPFWRYKFHTTTQTASVPELTQQRTWMNKIQFFNAFARMEAHDSLGGNYILTKSLIQMLVYSKTDLLMETMDIVFDSLKLPEPPLKLEDAALLVADDSLATKKKKKKKEEDAMSWFDYLSSHYRDEVAKPAQWKPGLKSLRGLENDIDRREFKRRIKVLYEAQIRTEVSFFLNSDSSKKEATRDDKRLKWKESFNASRPPGIPALIYWGSSRTEDVLIPTLFFPASFYSERSPTIVFSHGHNTDMGDWLEWLRTARDYLRFFNVMTYEYPGYGMLCKSEVSKARCFAALDSCMSVLNRVYKVPVDNTVLMGFDMGAGLSISYAAHLSEHRLHLAGVAILAATCSAFVGFLGGAVDWDVPVNFDELVEVSCPVFVGHGERDRVTSPRHSLAIAKELRLRTGALTRLNIIKSAGHGLKPLYFYSDLIEFLKNDINQNGRNIFYDDDPDDSPEEWQTHLPSNCPSPVRNDAEADLAYENQWGKHTDLEAGEKQNLIR